MEPFFTILKSARCGFCLFLLSSLKFELMILMEKPPTEEQQVYLETLLSNPGQTQRVIETYTYDSVIFMALMLNVTMSELAKLHPPKRLEEFTSTSSDIAQVVFESKSKVSSFSGLTVSETILLLY